MSTKASNIRTLCPAPHGAGGLKYTDTDSVKYMGKSRPPRGGWIEMYMGLRLVSKVYVPPPTGRVD